MPQTMQFYSKVFPEFIAFMQVISIGWDPRYLLWMRTVVKK